MATYPIRDDLILGLRFYRRGFFVLQLLPHGAFLLKQIPTLQCIEESFISWAGQSWSSWSIIINTNNQDADSVMLRPVLIHNKRCPCLQLLAIKLDKRWKEGQAQRGEVTCPGAPRRLVAEMRIHLRYPWSQANSLSYHHTYGFHFYLSLNMPVSPAPSTIFFSFPWIQAKIHIFTVPRIEDNIPGMYAPCHM